MCGIVYCVVCTYVCVCNIVCIVMLWTRTSRSHDISGPVEQVSVLVVLDGGACSGALQAPSPRPRPHGQGSAQGRGPSHAPSPHSTAPKTHRTHHATCHGERARDRHDRVVLYPTIRQWNGCPSDKRQLVWRVVHAVRGQTGGRSGDDSGRPSRAPRPPAAAGRGAGRDFRDGNRRTPTLERNIHAQPFVNTLGLSVHPNLPLTVSKS